MNIINRIKSLFKQEQTSQALINLNSLVYIPPREEITDKSILDKIDRYKEEYLKIIHSKNYVTSIDLHISDIKAEVEGNLHVLTSICLEKPKYYYQKTNNEETSRSIIDIYKLKICQNSINEAQNDIIARINAIEEILKSSKLFLFPNRKNALINEIVNLKTTYIIFMDQFVASHIEIETFLNNININKEEDLSARKELMEELAKVLIPTKYQEITSTDLNDNVKLALLELSLEKYINQNDLFQDFDALLIQGEFNFASLNFGCNLLNKEDLLKIEKIILLYATFSHNNHDYENLLTKFYERKLDILTLFYEPLNLDNFTNFELSCYEKIIMFRINRLVQGDVYFKYNDNKNKIIKLITKVLKTDNKFDYLTILEDPKRLYLLLSCFENGVIKDFSIKTKKDFFNSIDFDYYFDYIGIRDMGFEDYCKHVKLKRSDYSLNYFDRYLEWDDSLPIASFMEIIDYNAGEPCELKDLYDLYQIVKPEVPENIYMLPEGIRKLRYRAKYDIDYHLGNDQVPSTSEETKFINIFKEKTTHKDVYFPASLEEFDGSPLFMSSFNSLFLNEGLNYLCGSIICDDNCKCLSIPSTLTLISHFGIRFHGLEKLIINIPLKKPQIIQEIIDKVIFCEDFYTKVKFTTNLNTIILNDGITSEVIEITDIIQPKIEKFFNEYEYYTKQDIRRLARYLEEKCSMVVVQEPTRKLEK